MAALAWVSVHRVLVERDVAREAQLEADREKNTAIQKTRELEDRNDSLLVTRARAVVDSNPTEALAVLKDLRAGSSRAADGRAIAEAAVMRGVAWGIHSDGAPMYLTLDSAATKLALTTLDGMLHVWDLETHQVILERHFGRDTYPVWADNGRVLFDLGAPATGNVRPEDR